MIDEIAGIPSGAGLGAAAVGLAHSPLAVRMWETLEKLGIGILAPHQQRRLAKADSETRISRAQADRLVAQIAGAPSIYLAGPPIAGGAPGLVRAEPSIAQDSPLVPNAVERTQKNAEARMFRAELNVSSAILHAEEEFVGDADAAPPEVPDEDWFYAWRDSAAQSSAENMQRLWGRILAGEIKSPGKFSLRALDFLRLMSSSDAHLIASVAPFMVDHMFFMAGADIAKEAGVDDRALQALGEMGVLSYPPFGQAPPRRRWFPLSEGDQIQVALRAGKYGLAVFGEIPNQEAGSVGIPFTRLGQTIVSLVECEPNERYLEAIACDFEGQNCDVHIGVWENTGTGEIRLHDPRPLGKRKHAPS